MATTDLSDLSKTAMSTAPPPLVWGRPASLRTVAQAQSELPRRHSVTWSQFSPPPLSLRRCIPPPPPPCSHGGTVSCFGHLHSAYLLSDWCRTIHSLSRTLSSPIDSSPSPVSTTLRGLDQAVVLSLTLPPIAAKVDWSCGCCLPPGHRRVSVQVTKWNYTVNPLASPGSLLPCDLSACKWHKGGGRSRWQKGTGIGSTTRRSSPRSLAG